MEKLLHMLEDIAEPYDDTGTASKAIAHVRSAAKVRWFRFRASSSYFAPQCC